LCSCLQDLFTATADFFARFVGLIQRQRELTGAELAQRLVFCWMANPRASLEDIALGLGVSPQALGKRLGRKAHDFFKALIAEALHRLSQARFAAHSLGLLGAFPAVIVEDATTVSLPACLAGLFPGCGGKAQGEGAAAVKILLRYELKAGGLLGLSFHAGKDRDTAIAAQAGGLPQGCLYLADMGFFGAARLGLMGRRCYWISRVPAKTCVRIDGGEWQGLAEWLGGLQADVVDVPSELARAVGTPCRLVALRCPPAVADERRRWLRQRRLKEDGKQPSAAQLVLCDWTVFATNVSAALLGPRELWLAYRCRWQVELLFKQAKGMAGWSFTHGESGGRVMAELLAKVLGLIILHWATLLVGPALGGVSATRLMRKAAESAWGLRKALVKGEQAITEVLQEMLQEMGQIKPRRKRRRKPSTRDLLLDPGLAANVA
jgi:hypothetical protein